MAFQKALERDLNDQGEMQRRVDKRKAALFEQYGVESVDALPSVVLMLRSAGTASVD